jgi:hypothetical protein
MQKFTKIDRENRRAARTGRKEAKRRGAALERQGVAPVHKDAQGDPSRARVEEKERDDWFKGFATSGDPLNDGPEPRGGEVSERHRSGSTGAK